jgi:O-antigen ligase
MIQLRKSGLLSPKLNQVDNPAQADIRPIKFTLLIVFALLHIPLGLVFYAFPLLSTIHALLTLAIGAFWALSGAPPVRIAQLGAYIVGSEVLWRMSDASIFWEAGKYFIVIVFAIAFFRYKRPKIPATSLLAFLFLLPSIWLTLASGDLVWAKDQISFNLSGSLAVLVCSSFFSNLEVSKAQILRIFLMLVVPLISVASIAAYTILTTPNIYWTTESNNVASGGFGANQVSSALGLGILSIGFILLYFRISFWGRIGLLGLGAWFLVQCLLTFSRGGISSVFLPGLAIGSQGILRRGQRSLAILVFVGGAAAYQLVLVPQLDQITSGAFTERFSSIDLTGRDVIASDDLQIFIKNPLWGVGPGNASTLRTDLRRYAAAHVEYTRLLAEHGILGLAWIILLAYSMWMNFVRERNNNFARDIIIIMGLWAVFYLADSAIRLVSPAFAIGLTFLTFDSASESLTNRLESNER